LKVVSNFVNLPNWRDASYACSVLATVLIVCDPLTKGNTR
jgi:hypothetical protein